MKNKIITRFAPSPTGYLHLGAYRTAIFSYLFARKNDGKFILRIEDTDKERSEKKYEEDILESLKWMGLNYDEFYRQSEHVESHKKYLEKMIADGNAYISKEEAKDGSGIIKEIVRFKNPNTDVSFMDEIKGEVTMHTADLGDFVLAKNLNEPLFHLAVVVDDFEEGVTHVIRGEDHTSNTPRQILIQRAIGAPTPIYAHIPLVLGEDKLKLSKRRGAKAINEYHKMGFLPEAILNAGAFIGWNPGTEKEIFTHDELEKEFTLEKVQRSPAVFNEEKLEWFNREHMKLLSKEEIEKNIVSIVGEKYKNLTDLIFERISKWSDAIKIVEELEFFITAPSIIDTNKLNFKETSSEKTKEHIQKIIEILENLNSYTEENIKENIFNYANTQNTKGEVLHPMRYALSGLDKSPDPFKIAYILGKNETISRLQKAI